MPESEKYAPPCPSLGRGVGILERRSVRRIAEAPAGRALAGTSTTSRPRWQFTRKPDGPNGAIEVGPQRRSRQNSLVPPFSMTLTRSAPISVKYMRPPCQSSPSG